MQLPQFISVDLKYRYLTIGIAEALFSFPDRVIAVPPAPTLTLP
jgi:hypothetical protein